MVVFICDTIILFSVGILLNSIVLVIAGRQSQRWASVSKHFPEFWDEHIVNRCIITGKYEM